MNLVSLCGLISQMRYRIALLLLVLLAACSPKVPSPTSIPSEVLIPWLTPTPLGTPDLSTAVIQPTVTPTLRVHVVASGEVLGYIAGRYGVTVAQIVAANPGMNPDLLTIGQKITIPNPVPGSNIVSSGSTNPTPTPVVVDLGSVNCNRSLEGGAWCFFTVHNGQGNMIENVSADIKLFDAAGQQVGEQVAYTILDVIPAGGVLPIAAYFDAPVPSPVTATAMINSGILVPTGDTRYLPATIRNQSVAIQLDGLSAVITGEVVPDNATKGASSIWVAAVAYDASDSIVGVRRWMGKSALPAGQAQPFSLTVYSSNDAIVRVELSVEARP
jgi:LysM repeat protein